MLHFDEKLLSQSKESVCELPVELESEPSSHSTLEDKEDLQTDIISEGEENSEDVHVDDLAEDVEAGSNKTKDWRRVRKNYESSKRYICVAATLTVNGKKTAGAVLKQMFTDANWVSGNYLHCHNQVPHLFLVAYYFSSDILFPLLVTHGEILGLLLAQWKIFGITMLCVCVYIYKL